MDEDCRWKTWNVELRFVAKESDAVTGVDPTSC